MNYVILDNQKRGALSEGRSYGVGFAFGAFKSNGKDLAVIETTMPISPCKDYLNDKVWSEATGKPYNVYGLSTTKTGIFDCGVGYVVFKVCGAGASNPKSYSDMKKDLASYDKNLAIIQSCINQIEDAMKIEGRTELVKCDGHMLGIIPLFWCKATYRISLWSLLVRALRHNTKETDFIKYLEDIGDEDSGILQSAVPKLKKMMAGTIPDQDLSNVKAPHSLGIVAFKF